MLIALADDETAQQGPAESALFRFAYNLRRRRQLLDLTQAELADKVQALGGNLYQQTIAKIESRSRGVSLDDAEVLARALNVSVQQLLEGPVTSESADELAQLSARADELIMAMARANDEAMVARTEALKAEDRAHHAQKRHEEAGERLAGVITALQAAYETARKGGRNDRTMRLVARQMDNWRGLPDS